MVNHSVGPDRFLCKHIRLRLEIVFVIEILQRTEQAITAVVAEGQSVGAAVEPAILFREGVVLVI